MKFGNKALLAISFALMLAVSEGSFAQLPGGLPKLGGGGASGGSESDVTASQDQIVKAYIAANTEILRGQSKLEEALGDKKDATDLENKAAAYSSGATTKDLQGQDTVINDAQATIDQLLKNKAQLDDRARATYVEGLVHLGVGLEATVLLRDKAVQFGQSAQALIRSASIIDKGRLTTKLTAGTYVAQKLPGHMKSTYDTLNRAIAFAQNNNISVPSDPTKAVNDFLKAGSAG